MSYKICFKTLLVSEEFFVLFVLFLFVCVCVCGGGGLRISDISV